MQGNKTPGERREGGREGREGGREGKDECKE